MNYDEAAAETKRKELHETALSAGPTIHALPAAMLESVLGAFVSVTPPEQPEVSIGFVTVSSLYSSPKAESRKPGNIFLSWRKLVDIVPDISLAAIGAVTSPVAPALAAVLAGLYIWNKVWHGSVESFSDIEALTILALWQNRNGENKINENDGLVKTNQLRAQYSLSPLSVGQYAAAVNRLVEIDCIELENGIIWLREWVRVKYS
ncbi:conserved hypothetical protein [Cupriavidus taiwanensis]|uniref:hypothetical protein n=1 Tax=Cupriavidus taiwanensis TaxID=164546 RepID=UPI000E120173|nr:hypothetical protein [Cupriavidus taiwanensis]SPA25385.1 conserved hypothetical protein [Cupriavidus taiwanensis]